MSINLKTYKATKFACFYTYIAAASIFALPPMLFLTFREVYGISYTLLGSLVAVNFCTQLIIDLIFTFFSKHFNIRATVRTMPLLITLGLAIYALGPSLFPQYAYAGLVVGTVIFSLSAGLGEVLISPLVAALPSDNPERDMSTLHSIYGYGVLLVVLLSSLFFALFGTERWMYLVLFWAILPIVSFVLYSIAPIPEMNVSHPVSGSDGGKKAVGLALCAVCIFLGSAAENSMTNWISGFMENALGISKAYGDIFGMALFAVLLAMGRSLYAKYGKNIINVLLGGMIGSVICYITAGICPNAIISALACILIGFCTSMLWPGTLIMMEEKIPNAGVAAYALMAAGGDLGASIAPQMIGVVVDKVAASPWAVQMTGGDMSPEQMGMKVGILTAAAFPAVGIALLVYIKRYFLRNAG